MEPIVIFGAFLVVFCGYIALVDVFRDLGRYRATIVREAAAIRRRRQAMRRPIFSASRREGGGAARWQAPLRGSA